jgi:hypothetical protein
MRRTSSELFKDHKDLWAAKGGMELCLMEVWLAVDRRWLGGVTSSAHYPTAVCWIGWCTKAVNIPCLCELVEKATMYFFGYFQASRAQREVVCVDKTIKYLAPETPYT